MIITGLTSGTRYNVQVRAESDEGTQRLVELRHGVAEPGRGQQEPHVLRRRAGVQHSREHPAQHRRRQPRSRPWTADGDVLTYVLEGIDADSFDIIATNSAGQIQTKAALNHEEKSSYSVAVRVRDGRGGTDAVSVTIRVTDVNGRGPGHAVRADRDHGVEREPVGDWEAPITAGPPITDYDYRYRAVTDSAWTEVTNTTISGDDGHDRGADGRAPPTTWKCSRRTPRAPVTGRIRVTDRRPRLARTARPCSPTARAPRGA